MSITHEEAAQDPERYQILANGAIYDHDSKNIQGNPGGGSTAITQARSSVLHKIRHEQAAEDIRKGMVQASGKKNTSTAVQYIGEQLMDVVKDGQGRDVVSASKTLMQLGDLTPDYRQGAPPGTQNTQINVYGDEISKEIMTIMAQTDSE